MFNFNGVTFAAVGTLIITRKPRQIIGWLMMGYPLLVILENLTMSYLLAHPPSPSLDALTLFIAWFDSWAWWLLIGPLVLVLQLFPTGKPISKRWRWPGRFLLWTFIFFIFFGSFGYDYQIETLGSVYSNPTSSFQIASSILDLSSFQRFFFLLLFFL
jgi:hypothetical protein